MYRFWEGANIEIEIILLSLHIINRIKTIFIFSSSTICKPKAIIILRIWPFIFINTHERNRTAQKSNKNILKILK